jgi:hypothetical protein
MEYSSMTTATKRPIQLDERRGAVAQKATEIRRLLLGVEADQTALKARQDELEAQLTAEPAETLGEAAEKARYLISLFAATQAGRDPKRKKLIAGVLEDLRRHSTVAE